MKRIIRPLLRLATAGALVASGLATTAAAGHAARAADPRVAFTKIQKECSSYSVDGQEQEQCLASFTVAASKVARGHKIKVVQAPKGSVMKRTVGTFTAERASAGKRFTSQVCSFGPSNGTVHLKFYAVVKDSGGRKLVKTKPKALC